MEKSLAKKSSFPRYHQLRLTLAQRIREGFYSDAFSMPGERELALEFGVARVTVRTALARLEEEGLVVRLRGRGTHAVPHPERRSAVTLRGGLLDDLMSMSLRTKVKVLDLAWVQAPVDVAAGLHIHPGDRVLKVTRVRTFKRKPISHTEVFVPQHLAGGMTRHALNQDPVFVLLAKQGVEIMSAEQTMHASNADLLIAQALGVPEGTALLKFARVYMDDTGAPVEYLMVRFHPTRYEHHMRFSRIGGETKVWVSNDQNQDTSSISQGTDESSAR